MPGTVRLRACARALTTVLFAIAWSGGVHADTLLAETRSAGSGAPAVERPLTVSQSGTLDVDVTDLAVPAAAAALRVAVTAGDTLVASATAGGRLSFDAVAGTTYAVRGLARPGGAFASAAVGVQVTRASDPAPRPSLLEFVATFQLPGRNPLQATVDVPLTIPDAGSYTITLADAAFPAAFDGLSGALFLGSQLLAVVQPGVPVTVPNLVASAPGATQYKLTVVASAATAARAGVYTLRVAGGPGNALVYDDAGSVGELASPESIANGASASASLQVTDFAFPNPLARVGALVTAGSTVVARQLGTGAATGSAPAGVLRLWRIADAGSSPGTYAVALTAGGTTLYSDSQGVAATTAGAASAYSFPIVLAAGDYQARVTDFQFPSTLQTVQFAVAQGGAILGRAAAAGRIDFTAAAGSATLLVIAQPPAGGAGLYGAEILTAGSAPQSLLDRTQAVGGVFTTRELVAITAGRYDVSLKDIGWPAPFQTLAVAVTRGGELQGKIFGGGTFPFDALPGTYTATFIATPSALEQAGLYALTVASSAPTVTLSADATSVQSGQPARLTWSSTGASACTASGAWNGTRATSGNEANGPLTADANYTLTCTGPGGTASASVAVKVTAAPASGGGGGGAFDGLALLAFALAIGALRRARPAL